MLCSFDSLNRWRALVLFVLVSTGLDAFLAPRPDIVKPAKRQTSCTCQYPFYEYVRRIRTTQIENSTTRQAKANDEDLSNGSKQNNHMEDDIAKRLSLSKDRAISALSQPKDGATADQILPQMDQKSKNGRQRNRKSKKKSSRKGPESPLLPPPTDSSEDFDLPSAKRSSSKGPPGASRHKPASTYSSLLPPPLPSLGSEGGDDSALPSSLSSWEEFLGGSSDEPAREFKQESKPSSPAPESSTTKQAPTNEEDSASVLPSISDLFPPEVLTNKSGSSAKKSLENTSLEGVLPVSELFYRSSQSMSAEQEEEAPDDMQEASGEEGDDEELPFSAEQSDQLTTSDGKVKIRRNQAASSEHQKLEQEVASSNRKPKSKKKKGTRGRKMVRRGMEMLVGGVPINADPPQRCIELTYQPHDFTEWDRVITLNSRDFGPLLHTPSIGSVNHIERGLYCEHFVNAAMKWDVCPPDLKGIVKTHTLEQMMQENDRIATTEEYSDDKGFESYHDLPSTSSMVAGLNPVAETETVAQDDDDSSAGLTADLLRRPESLDSNNILSLLTNTAEQHDEEHEPNLIVNDPPTNKNDSGSAPRGRGTSAAKGFGNTEKKRANNDKARRKELETLVTARFVLSGELRFAIGVSRSELESGYGGKGGRIFGRVLVRGVEKALRSELKGFRVEMKRLEMTEQEDGATEVNFEFMLKAQIPMGVEDVDRRATRLNGALATCMDDGDVQLAMAAAAKEEMGWPEKVRERVVEEFLFEEDDADEPNGAGMGEPTGPKSKSGSTEIPVRVAPPAADDEYDGPFGMPGSKVYAKDDIWLGGGNGGVFFDYSEGSIESSPFQGALGPLLVDAVVERTRQRQPRVIAIGDVHGCIDELQDLLRQCDYQPGDVVCFLGDLVSKGPDSISVVQMAREIGAIGVRGNHDFEVIRWHQAIKSGVDPPVVGSEHFHVASCLSTADMKWMYSLPWFISSKELGALFVHAGFVSGIRLAKQNPRLMMNMRSILPDGTVTSKFFNNWPWARLWDGPQTVLFGHDADRGLQQYEHAIGLDTGCVYGGRLTACILPEKRLVSVSARREYFKYRRKHYD